jgi:hypothetical protein
MIPHPSPDVKHKFGENYKIRTHFSGKTEIRQNVPPDGIFGTNFAKV